MMTYEMIVEEMKKLSVIKEAFEVSELQDALNKGWVESNNEGKIIPIRLRDAKFVVVSTTKQPKNMLAIDLLCVDGGKEYHMKKFKYTVFLSNKHMLESRYKVGEIVSINTVSAYSNTENMQLKSGKIMTKSSNEYIVSRLYVVKPGREKK